MKDLREIIAALRKKLSDEMDNGIAEKTRLDQRFKTEMENQTKHELQLSDRVAAVTTELEGKKAEIEKLNYGIEKLKSGIEKLKAENSLMADSTCVQVKELTEKITEHVARESNIYVELSLRA